MKNMQYSPSLSYVDVNTYDKFQYFDLNTNIINTHGKHKKTELRTSGGAWVLTQGGGGMGDFVGGAIYVNGNGAADPPNKCEFEGAARANPNVWPGHCLIPFDESVSHCSINKNYNFIQHKSTQKID